MQHLFNNFATLYECTKIAAIKHGANLNRAHCAALCRLCQGVISGVSHINSELLARIKNAQFACIMYAKCSCHKFKLKYQKPEGRGQRDSARLIDSQKIFTIEKKKGILK